MNLELECVVCRLGLGAKFLPHSRVANSIDRVENNLRKIIGGSKGGRGGKSGEEEKEEEEVEEEEGEEEEEEESRVCAFKKSGVSNKEKVGKEADRSEGAIHVKQKKKRRGVNREKREILP